nr:MAG TPA: hypothetical protein [Caudoviricetes sp.]
MYLLTSIHIYNSKTSANADSARFSSVSSAFN